jgi:hypothetical protein
MRKDQAEQQSSNETDNDCNDSLSNNRAQPQSRQLQMTDVLAEDQAEHHINQGAQGEQTSPTDQLKAIQPLTITRLAPGVLSSANQIILCHCELNTQLPLLRRCPA